MEDSPICRHAEIFHNESGEELLFCGKPYVFAMARKTMGKFLKEDKGLRLSYQANIAMLIYDDQMAGIESRSHEPPTNLSTNEGCNSIADRLINLIWG